MFRFQAGLTLITVTTAPRHHHGHDQVSLGFLQVPSLHHVAESQGLQGTDHPARVSKVINVFSEQTINCTDICNM
jgi:hypothetical protein